MLTYEPTRPAFILQVSICSTNLKHMLDQRERARSIASAKVTFSEPNRADDVSPAHMSAFKPSERSIKFRDTVIELTCFDFPVAANHPGPRGIARERLECERLFAALHPAFGIALLDVC